MNFRRTTIKLLLLSTTFWVNALQAGQPIASINGAACTFNNISDAIAAAQPNDTINIKGGTHQQLIGEIPISLTLVASRGATGCEFSDSLIFATIDGMGQTFDATGGLVKITNGAHVTFRNMALTNASAINGGVMAIIDGSGVTLDNVDIYGGSALTAGGNVYISAGTGIQSSFNMNNGSRIYSGTVVTGDGGGLALYSSKLLINEGSIGLMGINQGNSASHNGGGIYAENSNLVINNFDSLIQNNTADFSGGGIYAKDSGIDINSVTVKDNAVQNNGGGIYLNNTNLTLKDATVTNNQTFDNSLSTLGGGGLYLRNSSHVIVDSSTILSNTSKNLGGGILSIDSSNSISIINGSDIFNNGALFGGGISTRSPLLIDNSRVSFNTASQFGGGISCNECPSLSVVNFSQISNNIASTSGGGISIVTSIDTFVELKNSAFAGNTLTNSVSSFGGGISQDGGTLLIDTCTISGNSGATNGGGVSLVSLAPVTDSASILNSNFFSNATSSTEENTGGGALYLDQVFDANIIGSGFNANNSNRYGGAISVFDSNLFIDESIVSDNKASLEGGGIYADDSDLTIKNSSIIQNEAVFGFVLISPGSFGGGGIKALNSNLELINSKINQNLSNDIGGGLFFKGSFNDTLSIKSVYGILPGQCLPSTLGINEYCSEISNNRAIIGGGIIIRGLANGQNINLSGVAINGNGVVEFPVFIAGGVAIHIDISNPFDTEVTMENLIVIENDGEDEIDPIIFVQGYVMLNILSSTIASNFGRPIFAEDSNSIIVVQNSIIQQNVTGPSVAVSIPFISLCNNSQSSSGGHSFGPNLGDPQFISTSRGDYRLSETSPSLDSCSFGSLLDIDGNVRPNNNSNYDQGAFEMNANFVVDEIFTDGFE